ncbi:MAG TPA: MarR family transcriptional regulator [Solirubrobacteraceae bacterium]|nr:MarR family transcriptional regulator [Solirubrobacteraceae bacterium]
MLASKQVLGVDLSAYAPALELDTAARLRASIGKLSRRLRPTAAGAAAGLTPTRISILFTIRRLGPIRLSELAEEEGLNPTMLSRVIAAFADSGLVTRVSDPDDRRAALVQVTAAGRELCERMQGERTDVLELALWALADADRRAVEQALPVLEHLAHGLKGRRG